MSFPFRAHVRPDTFSRLVEHLRSVVERFPDARRGSETVYTMADAALGAFSVFFTQSPSFLDFQRTLQGAKGCNNAMTLFGIPQIPSDNQIRNLLDPVPPSALLPVFATVVEALHSAGHLQAYRAINGDLLVALDATRYFCSNKIHCPQCSLTQHAKGTVTYSHSVVTPVIVAPGNARVLPLEPELIVPQDGHAKQDCENAAAKRWLGQFAARYRPLGVTILGDDLYCKQPLCQAILCQGLNFILVCKADSHPRLYEWVSGLAATAEVQTLTVERRRGKRIDTETYRFVNQVPLRDGEEALHVNWCELTTTRADGKLIYHNAFATNHCISAANVAEIVRAGRARWKMENENNNTLKTKGYHLTHTTATASSISLPCWRHSISSPSCFTPYWSCSIPATSACARSCHAKTFFDDLRALTRYLCFDSWEALMAFMTRGLELQAPDTS